MKANVRYIICDWDGTLADSWPEAEASFIHIMSQKFGIDPQISKEYYNQTAGRALVGQIKEAAKEFAGVEVTDTFELESQYWEYRGTLPTPTVMEGAARALKELKEMGLTVVVWSGTRTDVLQDAAGKTGLGQFIDFAIGNEPGSDFWVKGQGLFIKIAEHFGQAIHRLQTRSIVIGDGKGDIEAGKEVGCPTIGIPKKPEDREALMEAGANLIAENISYVPTLLKTRFLT